MSSVSDNLVLELLRAIRGDIGKIKTDLVEVKERLGILKSQYASLSRRIDRLTGDVEQSKRRLDIVPASSESPEQPVQAPARLAARPGRRGRPRSGRRRCPPPGSSRGSVGFRPIPSEVVRRHHSSPMRSGPLAARTRCRAPRQRNRMGGSSGTGAVASIGSGRRSRRIGRGAEGSVTQAGAASSGGAGVTARSGTWLSCGAGRQTRPSPRRLASVSTISASARPGSGAASEFSLRRAERRDLLGVQRHHLDAEAGVDRLQPLAQQLGQMRAASRAGRAVATAMNWSSPSTRKKRATKRRPPCARSASRAQRRCGQQLQRPAEILGRADRLGEGKALGEGRRRARPGDRLLRRAERLVEPQHGSGAEPGGDLGARQAGEFAHAAQAQPAQPGDGARIEPQPGHRQMPRARPLLARRDDRTAASCPSGERASAQAAPVVPAMASAAGDRVARQPRGEGVGKPLLAAEQMAAAGDVEQQPVRRIGGGEGGVALAPAGECGQCRRVAVRVGIVRQRAPGRWPGRRSGSGRGATPPPAPLCRSRRGGGRRASPPPSLGFHPARACSGGSAG